MTRYEFSQNAACLRDFPRRWGFVAQRLLTHLVFMAALLQVVPVGMTSSRSALDSNPDASARESVSAGTHAVNLWATQPTSVTRVIDEKSNELESLDGGWFTFLGKMASPSLLHHWKTNCELGGHLRSRATLIDLNVRLQV